MATSNGSSLSKTEVYESLYLIGHATQQISEHVERLRSAKMFSPMVAELYKLAAHQLRAEIATSAVHNLTAPEIEEARRHETKRIRLETKLRKSKVKVRPAK